MTRRKIQTVLLGPTPCTEDWPFTRPVILTYPAWNEVIGNVVMPHVTQAVVEAIKEAIRLRPTAHTHYPTVTSHDGRSIRLRMGIMPVDALKKDVIILSLISEEPLCVR